MGCGSGGSSGGGTVNEFVYKFDETSGSTATNSSANSFNGTIFGASRVNGKVGNALHFGGSGSRVEIAMNNPISFDNDMISIDAWLNLDAIPVGSIYQIIGDGYYGVKSFRFQINNGKIEMLLFDGSTWQTLILGNQVLTTNNWNHVAFTYNGTTANVYINGNLDNSINITSKILTAVNTLYIATLDNDVNAPSDYQHQFLGTIDELRISKSYLTSAEISSYYLLTK